jgi:hypothetical protein
VLCLEALQLFGVDRVKAIRELRTGLIALPPSLLKRHLRKAPERKLPLDPENLVSKSPEQRPGWLHEKIKAVAVRHLERAIARLQRTDFDDG